MKKLSFLTLAMALMLTGAGCAGSAPADGTSEGSDSAAGDSVSVFSTGMLVNDMLYNEFTGNTEGYKNFTFMEEEGTCTDAGYGLLDYSYDEDSMYHTGVAGDLDAIVSLGTNDNIMTWFMSGAEGGSVTCSYTIDGESFDVTCEQGSDDVCAGTFTAMAK
jgi:hypothetical protein